jgi:hypothetical protein
MRQTNRLVNTAMMKKSLGPLTMMGFSRYEKLENVETEELIGACLDWRRKFLDKQDGIAMHCFLGNIKGQFADAILAVNQKSYLDMAERHSEDASSEAFMALLNPESIRLMPNLILKQGVEVPTDFSCIEFGTFQPKQDSGFSETEMLSVSGKVEDEYLANYSQPREHFLGKIDDNTYSEISFVQTLGAAREICNGYVENPVCGELLAMFDPESVDLDFWFVLA